MLAITAFVFPEWDMNLSGYLVISVQQSSPKVTFFWWSVQICILGLLLNLCGLGVVILKRGVISFTLQPAELKPLCFY